MKGEKTKELISKIETIIYDFGRSDEYIDRAWHVMGLVMQKNESFENDASKRIMCEWYI